MKSLFWASVLAMARVMLVFMVGAMLGRVPKDAPFLGSQHREHLGRLVFKVCWPAVTFTQVAKFCDLRHIGQWWPIMTWSAVSLGVGFLVASVFRFVPPVKRWGTSFVVATTFGNSAALPILISETLCTEVKELAADPDCADTAFAVAMLYSVPWFVFMFSAGAPSLIASAAAPPELERVETAPEAVPSPTSPDASPNSNDSPKKSFCSKAGAVMLRIITEPCVAAAFAGMIVGTIPAARSVLEKQPVAGTLKTIGEPAVACASFVTAAALIPPPAEEGQKQQTRPPALAVVMLCLVRLVIVPSVMFMIAVGARHIGFASNVSDVAWVVLFLEFAMPSAQTPVVLLSAARSHSLAAQLSFAYLIQYPLSVITITVASAVGLSVVF
eukprot:Hpha_TRINITY_DN16365_c1_g4::TRINITY_DN16365_c1_g4_i1::g.58086::m.58086